MRRKSSDKTGGSGSVGWRLEARDWVIQLQVEAQRDGGGLREGEAEGCSSPGGVGSSQKERWR